jgi:hypothetical protein
MPSLEACGYKIAHIFQKGGRKVTTFSKKVVENLPPEPQRAIRIPLQPKNVVETQPLLPLGVVENRPLASFLLQKSQKVVENGPALGKMWSRIDHVHVNRKRQ